jgi:hypothetical protein
MVNTKEFPNVGDTITIHNCNIGKEYDKKNWACTQRARKGNALTMKVTKTAWNGGGQAPDTNFPNGWHVTATVIATGEVVHFYRKDTGFFNDHITVAPGEIRLVEAGEVTKANRRARIAEIDAEVAALQAEKACLIDL